MADSPKPRRSNNAWAVLVIVATIAVGLAAGALAMGLEKGGALTLTDVGNLSELAPIQAELMPLDACKISYGRRDKRGRRSNLGSVFIETCTGRGRFETVVISVAQKRGIGFSLERSSQSDRFKVLVEKDEVPFPELLTALREYTPLIVADFARELETNRRSDQAYEEADRRQQQEAADRKARARQSYPAQ